MNEAAIPPTVTEDTAPEAGAPVVVVPPAFDIADDPGDTAGETQADTAREIAFQAAPFSWHGKELAPFAIDREGDWLLHRTLIGAPRLSLVFTQGAAFLADACRLLWFCSHDTDAWLRKSDDAHALETRIRAWAVAHIEPGEQADAVELAFEIYNRAHTSRALAKPEPSRGKDSSSGN